MKPDYNSINDDDMYIYDIFREQIVKNLGGGYHRFDTVPVSHGETAMLGLSLKNFLWMWKRFQEPTKEEA